MSNNEFSEMAKRLRACCIDYDGSEEADGAPPVIVPSCAELRRAAALLTRHAVSPAPAAPDVEAFPERPPSGEMVGGCGVCSGQPLKFGTGCTLLNCPYSAANLRELLRESLPYVAMKLSTEGLVGRIELALSAAEAEGRKS